LGDRIIRDCGIAAAIDFRGAIVSTLMLAELSASPAKLFNTIEEKFVEKRDLTAVTFC